MKRESPWPNKTAWKLYKENWRLAREAVRLRDGYYCTIPGCNESDSLQLDHCFSRMHKNLFFDLNNLGYLCGKHHTVKTLRKGQSIDKMVDEICRKRAGKKWWDEALKKSFETMEGFKTVWYQEQVNQELKEAIEFWRKREAI